MPQIGQRDDRKFNETCCKLRGVPEECMGLCRDGQHPRSFMDELPENRCDEHLHKIDSCVYEGIPRFFKNLLSI